MGRRPLAVGESESQLAAVDAVIADMESRGLIEVSDAATVAVARGLAAQVDAEPNVAQLWSEYRKALDALALLAVDPADEAGRALEDFLKELSES